MNIAIDDSKLISFIRITMICALVFHHVFELPNSGFFPRNMLTLEFLSAANFLNAVLHWCSMSAVPLLSIISGYLFFNREQVNVASLIKNRLRTVLYPSLIWTSFWLLFAFIVYSVGKPYGAFGWLNYHFESFTYLTFISAIVGLKDLPLAYQFWFIHDLFLTILLTPVIYFFLKRYDLALLFVVFFLWFCGVVPPFFFQGNVLCFFIVGAVIAKNNVSLMNLASQCYARFALVITLFAAVLLMQIFASERGWFEPELWLRILRVTGMLTAVGCMYVIMIQHPAWVKKANLFGGYSFLIFALHYPLIEFVKLATAKIPYQATPVGMTISLLFIPIATILLSYFIGVFLYKCSPRLAKLLSGGR